MSKAKLMWKCARCQSLHESFENASECCPVEDVWVCGVCESDWDTKEEAEECCKDTHS